MKSKLGLVIISAIALMNIFPTQAKAEGEKTEVKRISLEIGGGLNVILPFYHVNASYRLPVMDNKIAVFADYSPMNVLGFPAPMQTGTVGLKYYFSETTLKSYLNFGAGVGFRYGAAKAMGHESGNFAMPVLMAGIGTDLMITDNFGISMEVNASYPFVVRGTGNLKLVL